jgi:opacity protein-like surface antigen
MIALSPTYRTAQAQINIVDVNFYKNADPVIEEVGGILKTEQCLFENRAEELKERISVTMGQLRDDAGTASAAHKARQISDQDFTPLWDAAQARKRDLQALFRKIKAFPRCRNSAGGSTPQTERGFATETHIGVGAREPGKLYSVGRRYEPPKLHSVGTQVKPPVHWSGWYVAVDGSGNFNTLGQEERFKMTNAVTNSFSDSSQAIGFGFSGGYLFQTGIPNIVVGASAYLDILNEVVNRNFANGFFIGQTTGVIGGVNAQLGVVAAPHLLFYGEAGPAFATLDQNLNFSGPVTSVSRTGIGVNLGLGAAFQPDWQVAGHPVAFSTQINRIILPDTTFDNAGSPGFIYRNHTDITEVKLGVRIPIFAGPSMIGHRVFENGPLGVD